MPKKRLARNGSQRHSERHIIKQLLKLKDINAKEARDKTRTRRKEEREGGGRKENKRERKY